MTTEDYKKRYAQYLKQKTDMSGWIEAYKMSQQREQEKLCSPLPKVLIWNKTENGYTEIENTISLNKRHIGKDTVYWRRLIQATLRVNFHSLCFPFGYESFRLGIRLQSYTNQHLVLLRTNL